MPATVREQTIIGRGATVYGQPVTLFKVGYSEDVPGVGKESFAVSVAGREGQAPHTAGFKSVEDMRRYLHSTDDETFATHTADGQDREETRRGLGIPKGMVSDIDGETIPVPAPPAETAVMSEPNNTVATEQNPVVVPNAKATKSRSRSRSNK